MALKVLMLRKKLNDARKALESEIGKTVITSQNAAQLNALVVGMIEDAAALPPTTEQEDSEQ